MVVEVVVALVDEEEVVDEEDSREEEVVEEEDSPAGAEVVADSVEGKDTRAKRREIGFFLFTKKNQ